MRVTRRFEIDVHAPSGSEPIRILFLDTSPAGFEFVNSVTIERLDSDFQVAWLGVPIVNQLVSAAVDVATADQHVVTAQHVR